MVVYRYQSLICEIIYYFKVTGDNFKLNIVKPQATRESERREKNQEIKIQKKKIAKKQVVQLNWGPKTYILKAKEKKDKCS